MEYPYKTPEWEVVWVNLGDIVTLSNQNGNVDATIGGEDDPWA